MKYEYLVYTSPHHSSYTKFTSKTEALKFAAWILADRSYILIEKAAKK